MTTKSGRLRSNESFCGMIENLGDAYEAAEECYGMVQYLADQLARERSVFLHSLLLATPELIATSGLIAVRVQLIEQASENYKKGLKIGGVQKER